MSGRAVRPPFLIPDHAGKLVGRRPHEKYGGVFAFSGEILSATEPRSRRPRPPRPLVAITMRSTPSRSTAVRMASAGSPSCRKFDIRPLISRSRRDTASVSNSTLAAARCLSASSSLSIACSSTSSGARHSSYKLGMWGGKQGGDRNHRAVAAPAGCLTSPFQSPQDRATPRCPARRGSIAWRPIP